jgi:NADPH2:quinone reductase
MRAVRVHEFGNPATLRLDELPDPEPAAGQVVVEVKAIGVNPVDTYVAGGKYATAPTLPYTPGADAAGVISAVGEGVTQWQPGDRVIVVRTAAGALQGCYASHVLCHADGVAELPKDVTFDEGAAVNIAYVTAFRALLDHAKIRPNDVVLIHGATGGVGSAAVQIAKAHGLTVYATGGSEAGRQMLADQKADLVLDHHAPGYLDNLPQPPTVILEMLADVNLQRDLEAIAQGGRIVVIGSRGDVAITPRLLMQKHPVVTGMNYFDAGEAGVRRAMDALRIGLRNGDLRPIIGNSFPLPDTAAAWQAVMSPGRLGKIILEP